MSPRTLAPRPGRSRVRWVRVVAMAAGALVLSGCMAAKYKLTPAKERVPPPALGLTGERSGSLAVRLDGVIVYRSQGAWKRDAYWDEYVLTLVNHADRPVTLEGAELLGRSGHLVAAGDEPWKLEKASRTLAARNFDLGKEVVIHLGGGMMLVSTAAVLTTAAAAGGGAGGWAAMGAGAAAGAVAIPVFVGGSLYRNVHGRHEVEREFERRRLKLPAEIAPGATVTGSLFFPITPGPRQLALRLRQDGRPEVEAIDLAPLKDLHLKVPAKSEPAAPPAAAPAPEAEAKAKESAASGPAASPAASPK